MSRIEDAIREWSDEVDSVAAGLIEQGTPPLEATQRAVEIVRKRRQRAAPISRPRWSPT